MFDRPGEKIKKIAVFIYWGLEIAAGVLAFVFGFEVGRHYTEFKAGIFFGIVIGGSVYAYLSALFVYAFGTLVDNSEIIRLELKSDKERQNASSFINREAIKEAISSKTPKKYKTCPNCGEENPSNEMFCHQCGAKL